VLKCTPVKCDECIPLFNYYVNQQEAVLNEDAVITPECPQGYICDNNDPVVIPAGTKKIIPDVPTYDPNLNPDCDYLCEMDLILDTVVPQFGRSEIGNSAITVRCKDIGESEDGSAEYTVPGNLFVVSYNPALKSVQQALAEANQLAWDYGKIKLAEKIASGVMNCNGWEIGYSTAYYPAGNVIETTPTGYHIIATEHVPYEGGVGEGQIQPQIFYKYDTRIAKEFGPYDTDKVIRQSGSVRFVGSITAPSPYWQWWNSSLISYFDPSKDVWDISTNRYQEGRDPGSQLFIYSISDRYAGYNIDETYPFDITYNLTAGMSVKCGGSCWSDNRFNGYSYVEITLEVAIEDV
jgi:hypothetical protein